MQKSSKTSLASFNFTLAELLADPVGFTGDSVGFIKV